MAAASTGAAAATKGLAPVTGTAAGSAAGGGGGWRAAGRGDAPPGRGRMIVRSLSDGSANGSSVTGTGLPQSQHGFLKKKKTLLIKTMRFRTTGAKMQKFFGSFFQKRTFFPTP
jgi:hypothetical protein